MILIVFNYVFIELHYHVIFFIKWKRKTGELKMSTMKIIAMEWITYGLAATDVTFGIEMLWELGTHPRAHKKAKKQNKLTFLFG